ncbi:uncharacterized protein TNCT_218311 [Trichonephila clavata]|uniref:Uncharacterized protein n=1 Tax=Trichonephila clavata TaxID=2740835 RepID=A0A8X6LJB9_TRICU|nr:uncharacterized protein TNCT_218311 [Trichonephila clavata]
MKDYQCSEYLDSIKRKIIREFYGIEESNDKEILDTAKKDFDVTSFPFNYIYKGDWSVDKQGRIEFVAPVDQGVIFNLKSHLAASLAKDVLEDIRVSSTAVPFNKKKYLWCGEFDNKESREEFESKFLLRMRERYENVPKKPLKVEGSSVYIKDVFDDAHFIDSVTRYIAWLKGMGLQNDNKVRNDVKAFKDLIIEFIDQSIGLTVAGFIRNFPLNEKTAKILIPVVLDNGEPRILASEEAFELNYAFNYAVFNDLYGRTQGELSVNGSSEIYGIDFSNPEISHCVITKIIESSVINKDHELAIDPEQVLSPAQSPYAGPSGLRTPPNPRKRNRDSDIGESPPKLEDSVAHSSSGGPRSLFGQPQAQRVPTRNQDGVLKDSPRRESEKFPVLLPVNQLDVPGTSREFLPRSHLSSSVTNPHSSKCVGAAKNVQAGTSAWSQPMGAWPLPASSAEPSLWQPSRPSSWKGASESGSAWTSQPIGFWSSQSTSGNQWMPSQQLTEPGPSCSFWQKPSQVSSFMVNESSSSGCKTSNELPPSNKLNNKEKELIEALLYTFNLTNYTFGDVYTNFFAKDGKIVSLLHDNVDREKYLQKKFGKNVDAIDISAVKKVEKREKDEWVDRQLLNKDSLEEACQDCFPDEEAMKIIPIAFEEGEYVLDRSRDTCEVKLLLREQLRRFRNTSVAGKGESGDKPLTKEEKELFKALLYWFNLNNYTFEYTHTNFTVKNGEIATFTDNGFNVKEYLQELRDSTIKDYCVTEEEAYDLNEFPFKFLSNYIDINIVEEDVKSKKDLWVNSQVQKLGVRPREAITTCYPDESALEHIPIIRDKGGYRLDHTYSAKEVKSFLQGYAKGTSKAKKMKSEDNKDSGYSSGFVTDAENVSSKAEATTSGYESMGCENTGKNR